MEGKDVCILYGECAICKTLMCASMQARALNTGRTPVDPTDCRKKKESRKYCTIGWKGNFRLSSPALRIV